jgi:hypothetical protein
MINQIAVTYYIIAFTLIGLFLIPDKLTRLEEYAAELVIYSLVPVSLALAIYHVWN